MTGPYKAGQRVRIIPLEALTSLVDRDDIGLHVLPSMLRYAGRIGTIEKDDIQCPRITFPDDERDGYYFNDLAIECEVLPTAETL